MSESTACLPRAGWKKGAAFTLVELVVLMALAALFVLWTIPAAAHVRPGSARLQCLNNLRQMANAFKLYANDNGGNIVSAYPAYGGFTGTWCGGSAATGGSAGSYTYGGADPGGIQSGLLWPYTRSLPLYHCPTDHRLATDSTVPAQFKGKPILRSISMNSFMAGMGLGTTGNWTPTTPSGPRDPNHPIYLNENEMKLPVRTFVFVDEDGISINDGMLTVDVGGNLKFIDLPTRAHQFGYGISFMDGHSEMIQFHDPETKAWSVGTKGGLLDWMALTNVTTHPL
jgi:type II secretory pathway pseudopilin PulG